MGQGIAYVAIPLLNTTKAKRGAFAFASSVVRKDKTCISGNTNARQFGSTEAATASDRADIT